MHNDNLQRLGQLFWQFEIAGVPLPHLKARGEFGRREGEYWLKFWGERLLFCEAESPDKVFAVVAPCESEVDLVAFWRAAVERGDWGELYFHAQPLARAAETDSEFVTIYTADELAWTREWCGGRWIARDGLPVSIVRDWLANFADLWDSPFVMEKEDLRTVASRRFSEIERRSQELCWLRGSRSEWRRVLQACATIYFAGSATPEEKRRSKSDDSRFYGFAHAPFFVGWMDGVEDGGCWLLPHAWREIFSRQFVFVGWNWNRRQKHSDNLRSGWKIKPSVISAKIELALAPSQHEQTEARLFLRDWLRGKAPDEQIAELLR